ncbi:hypothetical protein FQN54_007256 [Arachnomyces sp. PD_36]|nr:hypothetical protein FQN54_007256 [Arachnomyces sp. PD_36]
MFATLRLSPQSDSMHVERTYGPMEPQGHQRSSCDNCRAKKLRCSLEKGGCERCRNKQIQCVYPQPSAGGRKRAQQSEKSSAKKKSAESAGLTPPTPRSAQSIQTPPHTASRPGTADLKDLSCPDDLFPLRDFTTMDDADFVPDTSMTDILDMMPNGFNVEEFAHLDGYPGTEDGQLPFNPETYTSSLSDRNIQSALQIQNNIPLSPRAQWNPSDMVDRAESTLPSDHQRISQPRNSAMSSSGESSASPTADTACQCLGRAIHILEDLENLIRQKKPNSIDSILSVQKQALVHGSKMVECKNCNALSASMLLLSLVSEKLVTLCERVATSCSTERQQQQTEQDLERNRSTSISNGQKVYLGEYEMESINEWGPVANVLLFMQSKRLLCMLSRLKNLAVAGGWQTHLLILLEAEKLMFSVLKNISTGRSPPDTDDDDM